jgi:hypothetical protein
MKPIKRLYLSTDEIHLSDVNIVLELSNCGRGFITAETDQDYTGKTVRLDVGYAGELLRWFTGYVERSQPAGRGFVRLFVRELAGVFDRAWPCSFQHPTLRDVAAWLTENSGITVTVPDAGYSSTPFRISPIPARASSCSIIWERLLRSGIMSGISCRMAAYTQAALSLPCSPGALWTFPTSSARAMQPEIR